VDKVGDQIKSKKGIWNFHNIDHDKFEEHVRKSVPGYEEGHEYISFLSDYFIGENSRIYDIGCSTGNLISKISDISKNKKGLNFIGVEPALGFEKLFWKNISDIDNGNHSFQLIQEQIQNIDFEECDLILSYYTMQFIHPKFRQIIFDKIYSSLNWGGGFFLFEKVRGKDARFQEMINIAYLEYKNSIGYSANEIYSKMLSLKGVLEPFTSQENYNFLERAGFRDYTTIAKNLSFEGILAIK